MYTRMTAGSPAQPNNSTSNRLINRKIYFKRLAENPAPWLNLRAKRGISETISQQLSGIINSWNHIFEQTAKIKLLFDGIAKVAINTIGIINMALAGVGRPINELVCLTSRLNLANL